MSDEFLDYVEDRLDAAVQRISCPPVTLMAWPVM